MKKISNLLFLFFFLTLFTSCNDEDSKNITQSQSSNKIENANNFNSTHRLNESLGYFQYGTKEFYPQSDNTTEYLLNGQFQYFAYLIDNDYTIIDNSESEREVILKNNLTNEFIKISNLTQNNGYTIFDATTSSGKIYNGIKYYGGSSAKLCAWCPVVEAVVAVITLIVDLGNSSGSSGQSQCQQAMNSLNCPKGSAPYMNYSSGWFSSSCSVGCSKP